MSDKKLHRFFYIAISILAAAFVWFYVNNSETVTITVDALPIEFINEDTTLADRGLMLLNGDEKTVDLRLQLPRSLVFRFDPREIRVVADMSNVTASGTQSLSYTILYPSNISSRNITVESPAVRTIQVQIGELSRKTVEIRCKVVGNVAEGYTAGTPILTPDSLELRGQQEDIMLVSYAEVTLNIDNASATIAKLLDFTLYDHNGQVIENKNIHPVNDQIEVKLPVMTVKEVPLVVDFIESPGARLDHFSYALDCQFLTISGEATIVDAIDKIVLGTLDLREVDAQDLIVYGIVLPNGINNLSGFSTATLVIAYKDLALKTLDVTQFSYENLSGSRDVTIVTSSLSVTLRGTQADIDAVTAADVRVIADLSDVADASGSYSVPANIRVSGYDIGAFGDYEVTVRIGDAP